MENAVSNRATVEFPLRPDDRIVESIMFAKIRTSSRRHLYPMQV
jgi:hypothetical protein